VGGRRPADGVNVLVPPGSLVQGARLELDALELHHLHVRRAGSGEEVRLLDGAGGVGRGMLDLGKRRAVVSVSEVSQAPRPRPLVLAVGGGERDRFTWLVEKAAELGVTEVVPLETDRTRDVASRIRGAQVERLRRRALEAIKQCGASWAPSVRKPVALADFAAEKWDGMRWVAAIDGAAPPDRIGTEALAIVVGPEGGFTPTERRVLGGAGFQPVLFGEHILRFETAALAAAVHAGIARKRGRDG